MRDGTVPLQVDIGIPGSIHPFHYPASRLSDIPLNTLVSSSEEVKKAALGRLFKPSGYPFSSHYFRGMRVYIFPRMV
jgi:hypothetical protein